MGSRWGGRGGRGRRRGAFRLREGRGEGRREMDGDSGGTGGREERGKRRGRGGRGGRGGEVR